MCLLNDYLTIGPVIGLSVSQGNPSLWGAGIVCGHSGGLLAAPLTPDAISVAQQMLDWCQYCTWVSHAVVFCQDEDLRTVFSSPLLWLPIREAGQPPSASWYTFFGACSWYFLSSYASILFRSVFHLRPEGMHLLLVICVKLFSMFLHPL